MAKDDNKEDSKVKELKAVVAYEIVQDDLEKLRSELMEVLKGIDRDTVIKIGTVPGFDPRVAAIDVTVCGSGCA